VVTGAARGIGRAVAVEMAANGADVIAVELPRRFRQLRMRFQQPPGNLTKPSGKSRHTAVAERPCAIRDIAALRHVADHVEREYGKIDVVVADAAIQGWKPLLEMQFRYLGAIRSQGHLTLRFSADDFPRLLTISNSTCWPSLSVGRPALSRAEMCTNTSFPPPCGWMNP